MTTNMTVLCRSYAAHVGLPESPDGFAAEVGRRLSWWPAWARYGAGLSAAALRWIAPLFLIGVPRRFESLSSGEKEAVLASLQQTRWPFVRGAFLLVKTVVLGTSYKGRPT